MSDNKTKNKANDAKKDPSSRCNRTFNVDDALGELYLVGETQDERKRATKKEQQSSDERDAPRKNENLYQKKQVNIKVDNYKAKDEKGSNHREDLDENHDKQHDNRIDYDDDKQHGKTISQSVRSSDSSPQKMSLDDDVAQRQEITSVEKNSDSSVLDKEQSSDERDAPRKNENLYQKKQVNIKVDNYKAKDEKGSNHREDLDENHDKQHDNRIEDDDDKQQHGKTISQSVRSSDSSPQKMSLDDDVAQRQEITSVEKNSDSSVLDKEQQSSDERDAPRKNENIYQKQVNIKVDNYKDEKFSEKRGKGSAPRKNQNLLLVNVKISDIDKITPWTFPKIENSFYSKDCLEENQSFESHYDNITLHSVSQTLPEERNIYIRQQINGKGDESSFHSIDTTQHYHLN